MKTIDEFCKMFRISRYTFARWREKGLVKVVKVDKAVRITDEEIERIKKENLK